MDKEKVQLYIDSMPVN